MNREVFRSKNSEIEIKKGSPCFIVAEVGVNHNGSLKEALKYLDLVKDLKADAVKFQLFETESLVKRNTPRAKYQVNKKGKNDQFSLLKSLELSQEEINQVFQKSKELNLNFICTPFDINSLNFLIDLKIPFLKLSSGDFDNIFFHKRIIETKYPVILSTGMSGESEIKNITSEYIKKKHTNFAILHCTSIYPAPPQSINLSFLSKLKKISKAGAIGYSDHTSHEITGALAFSQGAQIIEKHLTFSNELEGPDHQASLNPENFKTFISNIRYAQEVKGDKKKLLTKEEKEVRNVARKSLVFSKDLKKGTKITLNDIDAMRPASGLNINEINKVLNKIVLKNVKETELIKLKDLKD